MLFIAWEGVAGCNLYGTALNFLKDWYLGMQCFYEFLF